VRICHPNADSYRDLDPKHIYRQHETEKIRERKCVKCVVLIYLFIYFFYLSTFKLYTRSFRGNYNINNLIKEFTVQFFASYHPSTHTVTRVKKMVSLIINLNSLLT